jgi:hypothetical protein
VTPPPRRPLLGLVAAIACLGAGAGFDAALDLEPPPPPRPRGPVGRPAPAPRPAPARPREPTRDELLAIEKRKRKAAKRKSHT